MTTLRTPLYDRHVALDARIVSFGGFDMPVRYASEKAEHLAVRQRAGMFDVSHMGEVRIEGPRAQAFVQRLFTNDVARIVDGQALYGGLLHESGGFVDDLIVYRLRADAFFLCINASNRHKDVAHMRAIQAAEGFDDVTLDDESDRWAQLAVQGPEAASHIAALTDGATASLKPFHLVETTLQVGETAIPARVARTGYTGEDGVELYTAPDAMGVVWDALLARDVVPCGLASRDTLRLEAGLCLYGNDLDDHTTPLEAGLAWTVKFEKSGGFVGRDALLAQKAAGVSRRLRGIVLAERGIPRSGCTVWSTDAAQIGVVTSGTLSPTLDQGIAMAYLDAAKAEPGASITVDIRGKKLRGAITGLPFYRRAP